MKQNVQVVSSVMPQALRAGIVSNGFSCPKTNKVDKYRVGIFWHTEAGTDYRSP